MNFNPTNRGISFTYHKIPLEIVLDETYYCLEKLWTELLYILKCIYINNFNECLWQGMMKFYMKYVY